MNTLFTLEPDFSDGFAYTSDFITEEEEIKLYDAIQKIELHNFDFQGFKANRKVASFGMIQF